MHLCASIARAEFFLALNHLSLSYLPWSHCALNRFALNRLAASQTKPTTRRQPL